MEFLSPWSLLGLVLVPAIFLWGMLAPRGRPIVVGSLMLWRRAFGAGPVGRPSARVRLKDPLLWLDAGAVLLLVLACARPTIRTAAPTEPVATVVIDRTASMAIEDAGGPRWRQAKQAAARVLDAVGDVPVRVVSVAGASGWTATEETRTSDLFSRGDAPWTAALAAADVWPAVISESARRADRPVLVMTDIAPAAAVPANVHVLATGGKSRNAGLMRAATRIEGGRWWLLAAAKAAPAATGPYSLTVAAGGKSIAQVPSFLSPGAAGERVIPMEGPPPKELSVALDGPPDGFAPDNAAYLVLEAASRIRVLLVGTPDLALRRALAARDDTAVVESPPGESPPLGEADLVIACAAPLPADWKGPAAVILPPETIGPVSPTGRQAQAEWRVAPQHPLAEALYLEAPRVTTVRRYALEAGGQVLVGTPEAPLIVTWQDGGARRMAVLFGLDEKTTDWPHLASFPVFWSHALDYLVPKDRRVATHRTYLPYEPIRGAGRLAPAGVGFTDGIGVSFIGTDEGFQSGAGRDDSEAAVQALRAAVEARKRASLADIWPYLAAAALIVLLARARVAR